MTDIKKTKSSRSSETRENTVRKRGWVPPSSLQAPEPPDGFHHRWVRAEIEVLPMIKILWADFDQDMSLLGQMNIQIG